jgi:putative ubiquitin-RnfH superfamily antitoxin RatB of RatAB toxin-antitoxin module
MKVTVCWVDRPGEPALPGEPAFALAGADGPRLRARCLDYSGEPTLDALMTDPRLADLAAQLAEGRWRIAVYGKPARPAMPIYDGDRIELLGPIVADPRQARHARVRAERDREGAGRWSRRHD